MIRCFNQWIEHPEEIPTWITQGRTVLLPKSEDLSNERNYRPIICLNTCYKIFTGLVGNYMKEHAERNNIWDTSQLGTCSGVLGNLDQLIMDNAMMDEVRGQQRDLAVAFYDYQKAYDMVRHDWMIKGISVDESTRECYQCSNQANGTMENQNRSYGEWENSYK